MHEVRRYFETRLNVDGRKITGFISFGTESSKIKDPERGTFTETLGTRCFSNVGNACNIKAFYNHDTSEELGSVSRGNLKLRQNDSGLSFELQLDNNSLADEIIQGINDRYIRGCSPAFQVNDETWLDNNSYRIINDAKLIEISLTDQPAYLGSCAALQRRSREQKQNRKNDGIGYHVPDPEIRLS